MPDGSRKSDSSNSDLELKCARLEQELGKALARQTATVEILDVIRTSPKTAQPVFEAIVQAGLRLFPEATMSIALHDSDQIKVAAIAGPDASGVEAWRQRFPAPLRPDTIHGHVVLDGVVVDLPDVAAAQDRYPMGAGNFLASGCKAVTMLPIFQGGETVGTIAVLRPSVGNLSAEERNVLRTFTAQANIAIDNVQLLNEMRNTNRTLEMVSEQLARYIPPQLYHSIMAGDQKAAIESKRKKLTVFFFRYCRFHGDHRSTGSRGIDLPSQ